MDKRVEKPAKAMSDEAIGKRLWDELSERVQLGEAVQSTTVWEPEPRGPEVPYPLHKLGVEA